MKPSQFRMKYDLLTTRNLLCALGAVPHLLLPEAVKAQQAEGVSVLMEEVVVTARKREEGLQETPIAVSAFSGDSLQARGIQRVDQIANIVPNMTFDNINTNGGGGNLSLIHI